MLSHLIDCRRRLLQIVACFILLFIVFFFLAPHLFQLIIKPLLKTLPTPDSLIATQITTPLFTPIKLAMDAAIIGTTPFALIHIWYFVTPGLYRHERQQLRWTLISSVILFCTGVLFAFYLVLPFMFQFFTKALPIHVKFMPDMGNAVDFIMHMLLIFGLCFQVPLICLLSVRLQLVNITTLIGIRPYITVIAFIVGMLLTPPDVISQIMLAIPLCLLFELGILLARFRTC